MQYLKFVAMEGQEQPDYVKYAAQIWLEEKPPQNDREIELCRFKLREGSVLRTEYKDFYDIQTEFDTVNLADAMWSSRGGVTLSREITDDYEEKYWPAKRRSLWISSSLIWLCRIGRL